MKLVPLGDRVVLKQVAAEETTKSGIVLPGQTKEKPQQAEVKIHTAGGIATAEGQRNRTGQTGVPYNKAGIGRSDQQTVVYAANTAGNFLSQQSTGDQTEAPVQPAANGRNKGGDQDSAALVLCEGSNCAQTLLTNLCRCHRRKTDSSRG